MMACHLFGKAIIYYIFWHFFKNIFKKILTIQECHLGTGA